MMMYGYSGFGNNAVAPNGGIPGGMQIAPNGMVTNGNGLVKTGLAGVGVVTTLAVMALPLLINYWITKAAVRSVLEESR